MKNLKKFFAIALTVIMMMSLAISAFAIETVNDETDPTHTYEVYQIFAGTQAEDDTEGKLAVSDWGTGIRGEEFLAGLKASDMFGTPNIFESATNAVEVAEILAGASSAQARAFGDLASGFLTDIKTEVIGTTINLAAGYYLIVDTTDVLGENDAKNVSMLQVTQMGTFDILKKYDVPTVTKKVKDINDSTDTEPSDWQDSADYDINDVIPFQLTGTLPTNYGDYETYTYVFNDTISEGLTYNGDAKVYVVNGTEKLEVTPCFDLTGAIGRISCANLKDIDFVIITEESKIVVEYTATLNDKAIVGAEGNPNTVNLEYSNNPNAGGEGEMGTTPDDTVIVFTYKVIVDKINAAGDALKGAEFTLYKVLEDGSEQTIETVTDVNAETTKFDFVGLDAGNYILKETKVPAGYNGIEPIEFTITAEHEILSDNPALTSLNGDVPSGVITFTSNLEAGSLSTAVVNRSGSVLPETGGIGTTIFYILGAALAIFAGVLLVVKKRMSSSEN